MRWWGSKPQSVTARTLDSATFFTITILSSPSAPQILLPIFWIVYSVSPSPLTYPPPPSIFHPGADRDLIVQVEDGKWGATRRGKSCRGSHEELLGMPSRGGKRRRAVEAGWQEATSRWMVALRLGEMGGEKLVQREIEAALTGERWKAVGDRSVGREKRNKRSRK